MKTVRIAFIDFWGNYKDDPNCSFYKLVKELLSRRYIVEEVAPEDRPQYLFYSCFGELFRLVEGDPIKIFFTGEMVTPDFNDCDYAFGYDNLTFGDRYMRLPLYRLCSSLPAAAKKHENAEEAFKNKSGFCSFVVSNALGQKRRAEVFSALNDYKKVDSGGKFMNNVGGPVKDKLEFAKSRKFSLCFENCVYSGYVTEKIVDAFAANTVPIYLGSPEVEMDINPAAFINCAGLTEEEIVSAVKKIDMDDAAYLNMLSSPAFLNSPDDYSDVAAFLYNIFDRPLSEAVRVSHEAPFISGLNKRKKEMVRYAYLSPSERLKFDLKETFKGKRKK